MSDPVDHLRPIMVACRRIAMTWWAAYAWREMWEEILEIEEEHTIGWLA